MQDRAYFFVAESILLLCKRISDSSVPSSSLAGRSHGSAAQWMRSVVWPGRPGHTTLLIWRAPQARGSMECDNE